MPTVIFHGLDDLFVPYGGNGAIGLPSTEDVAGTIARRNGCAAAAPAVTSVAAGVELPAFF